MQFDAQDRAALCKLDSDFEVSTDGERAVVTGEMEIEIVRPDADRLQMTVKFPGDETFIVRLLRTQLLRELGVTES